MPSRSTSLERAAHSRHQNCAGGADRRRLGRREPADIDSAHDQAEQRQHRPHRSGSAPAFGPGRARAGGSECRIDPCHHQHADGIEHGAENTGNERGDEQLAERLLGQQRIDHQDDARRNQNPERAAGGDGARRELVVIAVAAHFRQRHRRDGGDGGQRRAADRAEAGAGADRGDGQTAAQMADKGVDESEQIARKPAARGEDAHHQEQWDHRQAVIAHRVEHRGAENITHRTGAVDGRVADGADQAHRYADRQFERDQHQRGNETQQSDEGAGHKRMLTRIRA